MQCVKPDEQNTWLVTVQINMMDKLMIIELTFIFIQIFILNSHKDSKITNYTCKYS